MEYKIVLNPECYNEVLEIGHWYQSIGDESAQFFFQEFKQTIFLLQQDPSASSNPFEDVRRTELKISQYVVYFYLDEPNSTIVLLTILQRSPEF